MRFLRTNTAVRVTVGPFFDKTDGVTPETGLTVTSCKLTFMVDDGNVPTIVLDAFATAAAGNNDMVHVTGDDAGFYDLELATTQTAYLGRAMLAITDAATHCPVFHEFMILPAMVYDSLVLGTDDLDTNSKKWNDLTTVALPLIPTTAGRTLDCSVGGEAGLDWANIGSPTTAQNLSATNIDVDQIVASVSGAVGSVTGAVGSIGAGGIATTSFAAGAIDAAAIAANAIGASEIATDAIDADALAADAVTEIWAKAIAELAQAAPSATPTVLNAIAMLYMIARNVVTVTSTSKTFSNDAGTVVFKKALSDDGTTYTEAEAAAGP